MSGPGAALPRDIVLLVDDSPEALGFLTDALEQSGFSALIATSGQAALNIAERITPDIILLDAVMPSMDGFETCRRLKANAAVAQVPVIFMTGLTETEHVVRALESGGVDYLTKPINIDEPARPYPCSPYQCPLSPERPRGAGCRRSAPARRARQRRHPLVDTAGNPAGQCRHRPR